MQENEEMTGIVLATSNSQLVGDLFKSPPMDSFSCMKGASNLGTGT